MDDVDTAAAKLFLNKRLDRGIVKTTSTDLFAVLFPVILIEVFIAASQRVASWRTTGNYLYL